MPFCMLWTFVFYFGIQILNIHCGQDCLSCSNIENVNDCHHHITCNDNEVCYKHKYTGESTSVIYDVGCGLKSTCSHLIGSIFGRSFEGRHQVCSACCNNTRLCNRDIQCHNIVKNGTTLPRTCSDISTVKTGVYNIFPDGSPSAVPVYCVVNNEGSWTVIQRRFDGFVDFYRGWEAYKEGFGNASGEYWLGNENIHELTSHGRHKLRVELSSFNNEERYAEYSLFSVGDEQSNYQLIVNGYQGNAGDSLTGWHNGMKFSTYDRDNDVWPSGNCAATRKGGWWYKDCYQSNLNGKYLRGVYDDVHLDYQGNTWVQWLGGNYALKTSAMMIRRY